MELAVATEAKPINRRPQLELEQVLKLVFVKVGLRGEHLPAPEEKAVLLAHIFKSYGNHSCEEIALAFEMALDGRLDLSSGDVPCYNNFSCIYFSRIMNSYRRWAAQEYRQIERKMIPALEYRESVTDAGMEEWLVKVIHQVRELKYEPEFLPYQLYDWLKEKGRINYFPSVISEAILQAVARHEAFLIFEQNQQDNVTVRVKLARFRRMKSEKCFTGPEMLTVDSLTKKILLHTAVMTNVVK